MKDEILKAFENLGFKLKHIEDVGYEFNFEGSTFLYIPCENDPDFLNLCVPGIYHLDEKNPVAFVFLTEKINSSLKYIKAYQVNKSIWLFYEREVLENENFENTLKKMILRLNSGVLFSSNEIQEIEKKSDEDCDDNMCNESSEVTSDKEE